LLDVWLFHQFSTNIGKQVLVVEEAHLNNEKQPKIARKYSTVFTNSLIGFVIISSK